MVFDLSGVQVVVMASVAMALLGQCPWQWLLWVLPTSAGWFPCFSPSFGTLSVSVPPVVAPPLSVHRCCCLRGMGRPADLPTAPHSTPPHPTPRRYRSEGLESSVQGGRPRHGACGGVPAQGQARAAERDGGRGRPGVAKVAAGLVHRPGGNEANPQ